VGPFGVVEAERFGEGVEHAVRGAGQAAAFHPDVVVDRDTGEHRHFLAPQSVHAAVAAVRGQAGLFGGDACPPGAEELADLGARIDGAHAFTVGSRSSRREVLALPGTSVTPAPARVAVDW